MKKIGGKIKVSSGKVLRPITFHLKIEMVQGDKYDEDIYCGSKFMLIIMYEFGEDAHNKFNWSPDYYLCLFC